MAQAELCRLGVCDLQGAIAAADCLVDFKAMEASLKHDGLISKSESNEGGAEIGQNWGNSHKDAWDEGKGKADSGRGDSKSSKNKVCYISSRPHMM